MVWVGEEKEKMKGGEIEGRESGGTRENEGSGAGSEGRPPNPPSRGAFRQCFSSDQVPLSCKKTLVRHHSLIVKTHATNICIRPQLGIGDQSGYFVPAIRSGAWADIGIRDMMEDTYLCVDNLMSDYGLENVTEVPNAFYGVFDGHGGKHAADFACHHLPRYIVEDEDFPSAIERVLSSAFLQTDSAFAEACSVDESLASGTTALTALVLGRQLVVANAGDCRAVLSRRGQAIEMSRDHKPVCNRERKRIEASGGFVDDGYLNGQLNVARALGDWHMEGLKDENGGPLSAEPEVMTAELSDEDEFLIIGCDGIWDVFRSQNAVDFARRRLQEHNDPSLCSRDLVDEAIKRKSGDNLAVIVVCFQSGPPPSLVAPRARVQRSISAEGLRELQSFLDNLSTS